MPSFFSSARINPYLTNEENVCAVLLIVVCSMISGMLSYDGLEELYKTNTFVIRQCQVKSIDLKYLDRSLHPRWNITVVHENQAVDDFLIASTGSTLESDA